MLWSLFRGSAAESSFSWENPQLENKIANIEIFITKRIKATTRNTTDAGSTTRGVKTVVTATMDGMWMGNSTIGISVGALITRTVNIAEPASQTADSVPPLAIARNAKAANTWSKRIASALAVQVGIRAPSMTATGTTVNALRANRTAVHVQTRILARNAKAANTWSRMIASAVAVTVGIRAPSMTTAGTTVNAPNANRTAGNVQTRILARNARETNICTRAIVKIIVQTIIPTVLDITITETGITTGSAKIAMLRAAIAFVARSYGAAPIRFWNLTAQHARTANSKLTMAMP
jgi:hypothetical protein